jgi:SH3 domain-containing YSC84-like protein 1
VSATTEKGLIGPFFTQPAADESDAVFGPPQLPIALGMLTAGPVGRTTSAETDVVMKAEILSWSRARGVFGGVSLAGSTLCSDDSANKNLYGPKLNAKEIVREGKVAAPEAGKPLTDLLQSTSPKHAR